MYRLNFEASVFCSGADYTYGHPDFQRPASESSASKLVGLANSHAHVRILPIVAIVHIDEDVRVRIHPVHIGHNSCQCDGLFDVKLGRDGMVRKARSDKRNDQNNAEREGM